VNDRDLSEKLEELARRLETVVDGSLFNLETEVAAITQELRELSKQKYAPGNSVSWSDVKPKSTKKIYTDGKGRKSPF
jgi:hypothetical protein